MYSTCSIPFASSLSLKIRVFLRTQKIRTDWPSVLFYYLSMILWVFVYSLFMYTIIYFFFFLMCVLLLKYVFWCKLRALITSMSHCCCSTTDSEQAKQNNFLLFSEGRYASVPFISLFSPHVSPSTPASNSRWVSMSHNTSAIPELTSRNTKTEKYQS